MTEKKVKCNRCCYEWVTKSPRGYTSCPWCMSKVRIRSPEEAGKLLDKLKKNNKRND